MSYDDHRSFVHRLLDQRVSGSVGRARCDYCGRRCFGRTCPSHRDLPQLEAAATQDRVTPAAKTTHSKGV